MTDVRRGRRTLVFIALVFAAPILFAALLAFSGWLPEGRAHDVVVHLHLMDGKVVVEWDGIEYGIAQDLIEAGIDPQDIVYAERERSPKTK